MIEAFGGKTRWSWRVPVVALLLFTVGPYSACYAYNAWWWAGAEAAVHETVTATAAGRTPAGLTVRIDSGEVMHPSVDFQQPYTIEGADNVLAGTTWADLVSPGVWVAHLKFPNGHAYHAEAQRVDGRWWVSIAPAEGT